MAEYIERIALIKHYRALANIEWNKKVSPVSWSDAYEEFIDHLEEYPSADVVPRAEVEALVLQKMKNRCHTCVSAEAKRIDREQAKAEIAREIFEDIKNNSEEHLFVGRKSIIALRKEDFLKLEKKYTGGVAKPVLISIQPYWVFLIIAKAMGWNAREKKVEVRKNYPKDESWNKVAKIYCAKNKKSFAKIPKEYQPFMEKFLGKVIGEFVCDRIRCEKEVADGLVDVCLESESCLSTKGLLDYADGKALYSWHISDLVIYDVPKELSEFKKMNRCWYEDVFLPKIDCSECQHCFVTRPPQSWCYVEELR